MKTKIKIIAEICVIVLLGMFCACGTEIRGDEYDSDVIEESVDKSVQENEGDMPSDIAEEKNSNENKYSEENDNAAVVLAVGFDEEFEIRSGEKLYVGREGVSIELTEVSKIDFAMSVGVYFEYILKIDNKEVFGSGLYEGENQITMYQLEYTKNRVNCTDVDFNSKSVTLLLTSEQEIKEPLVLSGFAEDVYITEQPEYVVSEDVILFLDEGVKLYGNTMELLLTIFDLVQKECGMSLKNDTPFYSMQSSLRPDSIFDTDEFAGVDNALEKYHIFVVQPEVNSPYALPFTIILNPIDIEIAAGEGMGVVHEFTHTLQFANGVGLGTILNEGFATYVTGQITRKDEVIPFSFDADYNYSDYETEITRQNAEEIFVNENGDKWQEYLYGYRFVSFLFETYGEDIYRTILKDATDSAGGCEYYYTNAEMVPILKRNTSEYVFEEFADWLEANKDRFE